MKGRKQHREWISCPFNTQACTLITRHESGKRQFTHLTLIAKFCLSLSLCIFTHTLCLSSLPSIHVPPRRTQASRWGPVHYAWWVCGARGWRERKGKEITHQFQQGGRSECGDPGGSRQEDAGETRQGQRHYLRPHCHEHGEDGRREGKQEVECKMIDCRVQSVLLFYFISRGSWLATVKLEISKSYIFTLNEQEQFRCDCTIKTSGFSM